MKLYFLVTECIGENNVTIVSEKMLFNMASEQYKNDGDESVAQRMFNYIVGMANGKADDIDALCLDYPEAGYSSIFKQYVCKSMAQVKAVKKREIRLQMELLKAQMTHLEYMNINAVVQDNVVKTTY